MTGAGISAVIFDFDGVIVESLEVKETAFRDLFADYPEHVERIVQLHRENLGISRYEKFRVIYGSFLGRDLGEAEMARLDRRLSELVYERVLACELVAGARELLERLARRVPLFVASGTPEEELTRIVRARRLSHLFAAVRGSPTPKDRLVAEILREHGLEASAVVLVGDATTDHRAAVENGVGFVGRVAEGEANPFTDPSVPIVQDMAELDARWDEITAALEPSRRRSSRGWPAPRSA